jgi:hypothetical protein
MLIHQYPDLNYETLRGGMRPHRSRLITLQTETDV